MGIYQLNYSQFNSVWGGINQCAKGDVQCQKKNEKEHELRKYLGVCIAKINDRGMELCLTPVDCSHDKNIG